MKFIDLFAGIGGFHYGIEKAYSGMGRNRQADIRISGRQEAVNSAGEDLSQAQRPDRRIINSAHSECAYSNEWDKYANSVYRKHFGECDQSDIRTVDARSIPDHDLLCGGFPCQSFSVAGKRGGFNDTRGTLFFDIARILREKQPRLCLLENVKGLLSHDNGRTFKTILTTLTELGYDVQWQVLNSKNWVPQNRERIFIIGHIRGTPRPEVFPFRENSREDDGTYSSERTLEDEVASTLTVEYAKNQHGNQYVVEDDQEERCIHVKGMLNDEKWQKFNESSRRVYDPKGIAPTVPTSAGGGHTPKIQPLRWTRTDKGREYRRRIQKEQGRDTTPFNAGYRKLVEAKESIVGTITNALTKDSLLKHDIRIRRLTPVECERLQGFPDDWTKYGADGELISDTQRYKMCGNAVTTNVIAEIMKRLI